MGSVAPTVRSARVGVRELAKSVFRHQVGAFAATLADFGTMTGLVQLALMSPVYATGSGAAVGGLVNFMLGRHWIFDAASHPRAVQALRYALVSAGSLLANMVGEHLLHNGPLRLHYMMARVLTAISVALFWNYPLHRRFVFRVREIS